MTILITSAIEAELAPLAADLGAQKLGDGRWACEGYELAALGVGMLTAGLNLSGILTQSPYSEVIFTGSGGFYPGHPYEIGQLVGVNRTLIFDPSAEQGMGHYAQMQGGRQIPSGPRRFGLSRVSVACGIAVTADDLAAQKLTQSHGAQVENLELFGVAMAAWRAERPWSALLGLTNQVGSQGKKQWIDNYQSLGAQACRFLGEHLREG